MPLNLQPLSLASGAQVPQTLDIDSYAVKFLTEGDGLTSVTQLTATFIRRIGKLPDSPDYLKIEDAGRVVLDDSVLKAFPHYPELVQYLGQQLYGAWLAQNPGYSPAA